MAKILVVDDEQAMAKIIEMKLQKSGLDATAVFSGKEGLSELETNNYDVALIDIMMPEIDGWEILKTAKLKKIKTKIVVTTNLSQEEDKKKALFFGAVDYLIKSDNSLADIEAKVKKLI